MRNCLSLEKTLASKTEKFKRIFMELNYTADEIYNL
jgi:hypothetical protein